MLSYEYKEKGAENMPTSEKEIIEAIRRNECITKEAVLRKLSKKIKKYMSEAEENPKYPKTYYALMVMFLAAFEEKIQNSVLFDNLPDYWVYELEYQYDEFSLNIEHYKEYKLEEDGGFRSGKLDAVYKLISLRPDSFSVEQYAKFYEVEQGTVRQWIRRGKIRDQRGRQGTCCCRPSAVRNTYPYGSQRHVRKGVPFLRTVFFTGNMI